MCHMDMETACHESERREVRAAIERELLEEARLAYGDHELEGSPMFTDVALPPGRNQVVAASK